MSLVGNLKDLGLGEILQIVSLSRKSGILSLHSRGRDSTIIFRSGQVVRATSTSFQQNLGDVLLQKGVIDLSTLHKALALQKDEGFRDRLGTLLTKFFGVSQSIIEGIVREQIENVVFTLFGWQDGSFEFVVRDHIETVDGIQLDPLQFMLDQGLNPQFLAMEGTRILDEMRHEAETGGDTNSGTENHDVDFEFDLIEKVSVSTDDDRTPSARNIPLVVVDDDERTLRVMAEGLRQRGFDVHAMQRSEDTLIMVDSLCRSGDNPVVLIDLMMPKMDGSGTLGGLELLEMLHNNFRHLRMLAMSDVRHEAAESKVREMHRTFIKKPLPGELPDTPGVRAFLNNLCLEIGRTGGAVLP